MKTIEIVNTGNKNLLGVLGTTNEGHCLNIGMLEDATSSNPILRLYSPCSVETAGMILKAVTEKLAGGKPVDPGRSLSRETTLTINVQELEEELDSVRKSWKADRDALVSQIGNLRREITQVGNSRDLIQQALKDRVSQVESLNSDVADLRRELDETRKDRDLAHKDWADAAANVKELRRLNEQLSDGGRNWVVECWSVHTAQAQLIGPFTEPEAEEAVLRLFRDPKNSRCKYNARKLDQYDVHALNPKPA